MEYHALTFGRLVAVGIGCLLMRDDGIGPRVAAALQKEALPPAWLALSAETDCAFALSHLQPGDYVVLLDAAITEKPPATLTLFPAGEGWRRTRLSQHEAALWDMLLLVPGTGGCVLGIEADIVAPGLELSPALADAFGRIVQDVMRVLHAIAQERLR